MKDLILHNIIIFFLLATICTNPAVQQVPAVGCVDENNQPVDWFINYKLPVNTHPPIDDAKGFRYAYLTSKNKEQYTFSNKFMLDQSSMLSQTLATFLSYPPGTFTSFTYNDQFYENPAPAESAHAKGIIVLAPSTGFWIWHTIPNYIPFPTNIPNHNQYPNSGAIYGQLITCISLRVTPELKDQLLNYLGIINANCYFDKLDGSIGKENCVDSKIPPEPKLEEFLFDSTGRDPFRVFYKSRFYEEDIYEQAARVLGGHFNVQTHRPGLGDIPGVVTNLVDLTLNTKTEDYSWISGSDHSKWMNRTTTATSQLCVGDLNRVSTQKMRGGGLLCFPENTKILV